MSMHSTQEFYQAERCRGRLCWLECGARILIILHRKLNMTFPYYTNSAYRRSGTHLALAGTIFNGRVLLVRGRKHSTASFEPKLERLSPRGVPYSWIRSISQSHTLTCP